MLTEREYEIIRRRAAGEGQQQIARALKITQAAVSQFETNAQRKILEAERMRDVLAALGVKVEETFSGKRVRYKRGGRR